MRALYHRVGGGVGDERQVFGCMPHSRAAPHALRNQTRNATDGLLYTILVLMFAYAQQPVPQPAAADARAFGLVLPGYPVVFDPAFQRVAPDRWILPIEFAQVSALAHAMNTASAVTRAFRAFET